jgi:allantoin racemase
MPTEIMVLNPWGVDYMDEATREVVEPFAGAGTTITVSNLGDAAPRVPWPSGDIAGPLLEKVREAADQGCGAVVVGCAADPFLSEVRAEAPIPVVGVTESVCAAVQPRGRVGVLARRLNDSYLSLIPAQGNKEFWPNMLRGYGIDEGAVSVRAVPVRRHPEPDELIRMTDSDPTGLCDRILDAMTEAFLGEGVREAERSVHEDGAQALFFACTFWSRAIAESANRLGDRLGVPVVNPLLCAVARAQRLLDE